MSNLKSSKVQFTTLLQHLDFYINGNIRDRLIKELLIDVKERIKVLYLNMNSQEQEDVLNIYNILNLDNDILIKWIEFRFDNNMNWDNYGDLWQIDHILPITKFDFNNKNDISICFHWTNLQPLYKCENKSKTNKLELHYYYNNIVNVHRFSQYYKQDGYQAINESLLWLRKKLRYGNNPMYENTKVFEIDNPQPSL